MPKLRFSQEMLKTIACLTMLLDHVGAIFVKGYTLRIIGRIAFPIYCFLLAEGVHYTKHPGKYALRLAIGVLLSELPFDFAFRNGFTWAKQSVMITLLIGFLAAEFIANTDNDFLKIAVTACAFWVANKVQSDYRGYGVLLIVLFCQARGNLWLQTVALAMIAWMMNSLKISMLGYTIPIEMFALLAMIPIGLYSGEKMTNSRVLQWCFYLFYPVHLTLLHVIHMIIRMHT